MMTHHHRLPSSSRRRRRHPRKRRIKHITQSHRRNLPGLNQRNQCNHHQELTSSRSLKTKSTEFRHRKMLNASNVSPAASPAAAIAAVVSAGSSHSSLPSSSSSASLQLSSTSFSDPSRRIIQSSVSPFRG